MNEWYYVTFFLSFLLNDMRGIEKTRQKEYHVTFMIMTNSNWVSSIFTVYLRIFKMWKEKKLGKTSIEMFCWCFNF